MPDTGRHGHHGSHMNELVNEAISKLAPYSALILTIAAVVVFAYRHYFIEGFLMNTKTYKAKYWSLSEDQRRSLVNHHVAGTCKVTLLFTAAYPFLAIAFGRSTPQTPYAHGSTATLGDVMVVCSQLFTVMYIFELFYRVKVSPISAAHHVGAILIAQTAVAISLDFEHQSDAVIEFMMCFVWGAFDCVAELWPHVAMILYRLLPSTDDKSERAQRFHALMGRIFFSVAIMEICGTVLETIVVFWLWGSLWDKWTLPFRVVTPILHTLFSAAQLWGFWVFLQLSKKEHRKAAAKLGREKADEAEKGLVGSESSDVAATASTEAESKSAKNSSSEVTEGSGLIERS